MINIRVKNLKRLINKLYISIFLIKFRIYSFTLKLILKVESYFVSKRCAFKK